MFELLTAVSLPLDTNSLNTSAVSSPALPPREKIGASNERSRPRRLPPSVPGPSAEPLATGAGARARGRNTCEHVRRWERLPRATWHAMGINLVELPTEVEGPELDYPSSVGSYNYKVT